jgi:hypothetical protein
MRKDLTRQFGQAAQVCSILVEECRRAGSVIVTVDAKDSRSPEAADRVVEILRKLIQQGQE